MTSRKDRKGSILKTTSLFRKNSTTRNLAKSSRTIRFQRQDSFDLEDSNDLLFAEVQCVGEKIMLEEEEIVNPDTGRSGRKAQLLREPSSFTGNELISRRKAQLLREPSSFTGDELISLKAAFSKLDCDGDGTLFQVIVTDPFVVVFVFDIVFVFVCHCFLQV